MFTFTFTFMYEYESSVSCSPRLRTRNVSCDALDEQLNELKRLVCAVNTH